MRTAIAWLVGPLLGGLLAATSALADEIYFSVIGQIQGAFEGEVRTKGLEGRMRGLKFSHDLKSPRDAATGQPAGKRQHAPLSLTREWGRASPRFLAALVKNETLDVTIDFYTPRQVMLNGALQTQLFRYQSIRLKGASIAGFRRFADNTPQVAPGQLQALEQVDFVYQTIELTDVDANLSVIDGWITP